MQKRAIAGLSRAEQGRDSIAQMCGRPQLGWDMHRTRTYMEKKIMMAKKAHRPRPFDRTLCPSTPIRITICTVHNNSNSFVWSCGDDPDVIFIAFEWSWTDTKAVVKTIQLFSLQDNKADRMPLLKLKWPDWAGRHFSSSQDSKTKRNEQALTAAGRGQHAHGQAITVLDIAARDFSLLRKHWSNKGNQQQQLTIFTVHKYVLDTSAGLKTTRRRRRRTRWWRRSLR